MTATKRSESMLMADLAGLDERLADDQFVRELYRALAGGHLTKSGEAVALSWGRAEEVVNALRARKGQDPLTLAQTGGEGELSSSVGPELESLGWTWRPRDASREDPAHSGRPSSPPPAGTGERRAGVSDSGEWERTAHEQADAARRGTEGAPGRGPGTGAGGGEPPRVGGS